MGVFPLLAGPIQFSLGAVNVLPGVEHDVLYVEVQSNDLHDLHAILSDNLPNQQTHPTYKPHVTIAYVKPGTGAKYTAELGELRLDGEADELTFVSPRGTSTCIPLEADVIDKAMEGMSSLVGSAGGFLVGPPKQGKLLRLKRRKRQRVCKAESPDATPGDHGSQEMLLALLQAHIHGDEQTAHRLEALWHDPMEYARVLAKLEHGEGVIAKAMVVQRHREGQKFQGPSGRWFTVKNGRTVPTAAPNVNEAGEEQHGPMIPAAKLKQRQGSIEKENTLKAASDAANTALTAPHTLTREHIDALLPHLMKLTVPQLKEFARGVAMKVGGNKALLAGRLHEYVKNKADAAGVQPQQPTPKLPVPRQSKPAAKTPRNPLPPLDPALAAKVRQAMPEGQEQAAKQTKPAAAESTPAEQLKPAGKPSTELPRETPALASHLKSLIAASATDPHHVDDAGVEKIVAHLKSLPKAQQKSVAEAALGHPVRSSVDGLERIEGKLAGVRRMMARQNV